MFNNGACSGQNVGEVKDGQTSYEVLEPKVKQKVQLTKQSMPRIHKGSTTSEAHEQMKFMSAVMYFLIGPYVRTSPLQYIKGTFLCVEAVTSGSTPRKSPAQGSFWGDFFKLLQCHWDRFNNNSSPY